MSATMKYMVEGWDPYTEKPVRFGPFDTEARAWEFAQEFAELGMQGVNVDVLYTVTSARPYKLDLAAAQRALERTVNA